MSGNEMLLVLASFGTGQTELSGVGKLCEASRLGVSLLCQGTGRLRTTLVGETGVGSNAAKGCWTPTGWDAE